MCRYPVLEGGTTPALLPSRRKLKSSKMSDPQSNETLYAPHYRMTLNPQHRQHGDSDIRAGHDDVLQHLIGRGVSPIRIRMLS